MVVRVTADLTTPPTDEEVSAIHQMMLGRIMNPADPWRTAVRTIIEEFQRMRCAEAEQAKNP